MLCQRLGDVTVQYDYSNVTDSVLKWRPLITNESWPVFGEVRQGEHSLIVLFQHSLISFVLLHSVKGKVHILGNYVIINQLPEVTQIHGYFCMFQPEVCKTC